MLLNDQNMSVLFVLILHYTKDWNVHVIFIYLHKIHIDERLIQKKCLVLFRILSFLNSNFVFFSRCRDVFSWLLLMLLFCHHCCVVLSEISECCLPTTVLATNTLRLDVSAVADLVTHKEVRRQFFVCVMGEWLDILWCSVCLSLTFVTFFVKKYFFSAYQL